MSRKKLQVEKISLLYFCKGMEIIMIKDKNDFQIMQNVQQTKQNVHK